VSDIFVGIASSLAGCGLLLLLIGTTTSLREWLFLKRAIVTTGTIIERHEGFNPQGGKLYMYDILFKTRSDHEQKVSLDHYHELEIGAEVSIGYQAKKPARAMFNKPIIPGFTMLTACGLLFLLVGLFFLFASGNLGSF
jgi:hypothetical protein